MENGILLNFKNVVGAFLFEIILDSTKGSGNAFKWRMQLFEFLTFSTFQRLKHVSKTNTQKSVPAFSMYKKPLYCSL